MFPTSIEPTTMDAKLKSLKVTDLRDLLTKAGEPAPSKANKQDLIARVSASLAALAAYRAKYEAPAAGEAPAVQEECVLLVKRVAVLC